MNLLRACTGAYGAPQGQKVHYLERASAELDGLRLLLRISVSLRLSSHDQFAHASKLVGEVGRQLGGWLSHMR